MSRTFDYYRSTNSRLAATLDQEDNYGKYLKRVESIVNKKPHIDMSTSQYMRFMNKVKDTARKHHSQEKLNQMNSENQILLQKIINAMKKKQEKNQDKYMLAMHEKRFREQLRINQENKKIALRVISQNSTINLRNDWTQHGQSPRRINQKTFYDSRVKERKLPKLLQIIGP